MKRLLRTLTILLAALATIFAVAGCSNSKAGDTQIDKEKVITVIASTNVWGSVAKQLGGRYVDVTSILNNTGTDAHDYEPSTNDISKFQHAQVAILNGAGYDEWAAKAARPVQSDRDRRGRRGRQEDRRQSACVVLRRRTQQDGG